MRIDVNEYSVILEQKFRELYPQLTEKTHIRDAFNEGTEAFDLENEAVV